MGRTAKFAVSNQQLNKLESQRTSTEHAPGNSSSTKIDKNWQQMLIKKEEPFGKLLSPSSEAPTESFSRPDLKQENEKLKPRQLIWQDSNDAFQVGRYCVQTKQDLTSSLLSSRSSPSPKEKEGQKEEDLDTDLVTPKQQMQTLTQAEQTANALQLLDTLRH